MDRETIVRLAVKAGIDSVQQWNTDATAIELLERFTKLVAEHVIKDAPDYKMGYADGVATEREACAKLVEPSEEHKRDASWGYLGGAEGVELAEALAAAIRARGQA